jgi:tetratricopeptide (TPR) repeat protein
MHRILFIVLATFILNGAFAQNEKLKKMEIEGDTAMNKGDFAKAIKIYSKVVKSSKLKERADYLPLYKRAGCYYSTSDFHHALEDLNQVIPKIPGLPQARMLRALVYGELGQADKKKEDLDQALTAEPANPGLLKWRASVYMEDEDYKEAKKDLEVAKLFNDDAETEMYLGVAQYNLGSIDSAFQSLNKSIELDATYMPAYMYASSFSIDQDKYDQAMKYLDFAGRLDPKNTTIYFYKGIALVELEKIDEGCRFLRKAFYAGVDDASGYLKEYCFGVEN